MPNSNRKGSLQLKLTTNLSVYSYFRFLKFSVLYGELFLSVIALLLLLIQPSNSLPNNMMSKSRFPPKLSIAMVGIRPKSKTLIKEGAFIPFCQPFFTETGRSFAGDVIMNGVESKRMLLSPSFCACAKIDYDAGSRERQTFKKITMSTPFNNNCRFYSSSSLSMGFSRIGLAHIEINGGARYSKVFLKASNSVTDSATRGFRTGIDTNANKNTNKSRNSDDYLDADEKLHLNSARKDKSNNKDGEKVPKENEKESTKGNGFQVAQTKSKATTTAGGREGDTVRDSVTNTTPNSKKNTRRNDSKQEKTKKREPRGTNLLIVGLGNPGSKYENTRHNAGFMVIDELAKRLSVSMKVQKSFDGEYGSTKLHGRSIGLLKPSTFMNLSGQSVRKVKEFYKLNVSAILVIVDDVNLDVGQIKLRQTGSAGGQNGLKNIEQQLKTKDYARIRVGIGQPRPGEMVDYVLSNFSRGEKSRLEDAIYDTLEAIDKWVLEEDIGKVMHSVNSPK